MPSETQVVELTPQQVAFYQTFGFIHLPGLFAREIGEITSAFEEVFATEDAVPLPENPFHQARDPRFREVPRLTIGDFTSKHPTLSALRDDPRMRGIATSLLGKDHEFAQSDGNLFYCDVYWHLDAFGSPIQQNHIKIYFYLDALRHDTGALRVLPGTGELGGSYVGAVRGLFLDPENAKSTLGIELEDVPSWTLEVDPGDVIIGNYRTLHATFGGGPRRRLFTVNFREPLAASES